MNKWTGVRLFDHFFSARPYSESAFARGFFFISKALLPIATFDTRNQDAWSEDQCCLAPRNMAGSLDLLSRDNQKFFPVKYFSESLSRPPSMRKLRQFLPGT